MLLPEDENCARSTLFYSLPVYNRTRGRYVIFAGENPAVTVRSRAKWSQQGGRHYRVSGRLPLTTPLSYCARGLRASRSVAELVSSFQPPLLQMGLSLTLVTKLRKP